METKEIRENMELTVEEFIRKQISEYSAKLDERLSSCANDIDKKINIGREPKN
ncbi:hypothetical protein cpbgf_2001415 [Cryptosporidium parvum]|uniref:Uncharacterized protein n=1 Tax=Cryptosporidium parvum TaxID=5807 RepID=A0A7S7RH77_CRYPV|nr:hypothetical protein CPATCC_0029410 [Cryptosporidium parvum]WRK30929.1 hypothetical protein cpbgf_2001415 [Cryptosporidium parvum]|eukprot:QOY43092.1 hypothetical protein CPATCC_000800 [Cryptosporidium parvum]